jgi:hypothetical protein
MDDIFHLDKQTGRLFWKTPSKYHKDLIGKEAGNANKTHNDKCYWVVQVNGKKMKRGHIVYFMTHGVWPKPCIDHINGNSLDDRPENLRIATVLENSWNHKGRKRTIQLPMGVRHSGHGAYVARISYKKSQIYLGIFDTIQEASAIYQQKRRELYGEFA